MIRVLLAKGQLIFRTAVRRLLELEGDIQVVAEVARGDEVVSAALRAQPEVAVVDIEMPGLDGISAASQLQRKVPTCRALILTMYGRPGFVQRAIEGCVSSFVLKDAAVEVLARDPSLRGGRGRRRSESGGASIADGPGPAVDEGARNPRRVCRGPVNG